MTNWSSHLQVPYFFVITKVTIQFIIVTINGLLFTEYLIYSLKIKLPRNLIKQPRSWSCLSSYRPLKSFSLFVFIKSSDTELAGDSVAFIISSLQSVSFQTWAERASVLPSAYFCMFLSPPSPQVLRGELDAVVLCPGALVYSFKELSVKKTESNAPGWKMVRLTTVAGKWFFL